MDSVFDQGPPAPCPAPFNMAAHVLSCAKNQPDKIALSVLGRDGAENWSYAQIEAAVRGIATGFLTLGLMPGDIVLLRLGNTPEFPLAYLGAITAGLLPVPSSSQLTEAEVARIIADLNPALILHQPGVPCPGHPARLDASALEPMHRLSPADFAMGDPDRPGYIVYTSGTSGQPRAVLHAHRAIWARQMMMRGWYGLTAEDRLLHAGAFNWTYTLGTGVMDPWTMGATALITAPGTAPADIPALLRQHEATIFAAAPGVYRQILKQHDTLDLPALRHALSAGEKLSPTLKTAWEDATGKPVYEAYGMSEISTFISASPDHPARDNALGQPQQGRRIAILGDHGPVPRGEQGVIAVHRGDPGLMLEYLGAPEDTAARFQGDWFLTGDQGIMAADDQVHYLGRADDMMNAGGYRVSPIEVEQALTTHPGITAVGCAEVEVKQDARVIAAFYTGPAPIPEADLAAFAATRLARYKQPRMYIYLPELPTGPNGKLLRRSLKSLVPDATHG
ncbi:class I adenylate-forming enzyme family protein [Aestuariivita boseongensis]|uniref:class I adenylate-forming enzyme family protein n=1 Tax=Aestuariivita boseongensis TaxID=1470562 RepID=UPI0006802DC6|nr:class I adenylate-forming enzyme family protein [Aestuariivita boseongensis]